MWGDVEGPAAGLSSRGWSRRPSPALRGPPQPRRSLGFRVAPFAYYVTSVLLLLSLNFGLPRMMPGDPIDALMARGDPTYVADGATRAKLQRYYDLDDPLPQQYVHYLGATVHGDLGTSTFSNRPVAMELRQRLGWSFLLIATAMGVAVLVGAPLGIHSGWRRGRPVDRGLLTFFLSVQNVPVFLLGTLALQLLAVRFHLFPYGGATTAFSEYGGIQRLVDVARHLVLPAVVMASQFLTLQYLVTRAAMVGELGSDYVFGARAKGLAERRLKYGHAGRNALLPFVTVVGLQFGLAMTSVVFVERIFSNPGVGRYLVDAVGRRDYPAAQGAFLFLTFAVVTANLLVELAYRRVDPRTAI